MSMENPQECYHECNPAEDVRWVQMRIPMRVNRFESIKVPLCAECRKRMKGDWRYWKG